MAPVVDPARFHYYVFPPPPTPYETEASYELSVATTIFDEPVTLDLEGALTYRHPCAAGQTASGQSRLTANFINEIKVRQKKKEEEQKPIPGGFGEVA